MNRVTGVLLALLVCTGCVSVGPDFSEADVQRLRPGMQMAEVISLLGTPSATSVNYSTGTTAVVWMHATGNALGGGSARSVSAAFDKDNKLISTTISSTETH